MAETPEDGHPAESASRADWKSLHLWQIQGVRDVLVFLAVLGVLWLGQKISIVTVPLLLAVLFAYLFEPVIRWVMRRMKWDRQKAVGGVMAAVILVVVVPSGLGLAFGAAQAVGFLRGLSDSITHTYEAVQAGRALDEAVVEAYPDATGKARDAEFFATLEGQGAAAGAADALPTGGSAGDGTGAGGTPPADAAPEGRPVGGEPAGEGDPGLPTPDEPAQSEPAGDETAPDQAGGSEALVQPDIPGVVRARYDAYQSSMQELGEPGGFWRIVAEVVLHAGTDNTLDKVFVTAQQWVRANAEELATAGAGALATTLGMLSGAFGLLFMVFITAFFFYFISTGWIGVQRFGAGLIPDKHRQLTLELLVKFDAVINAFIRGRLTIAFIQSVVFTIGYLVIGVPAAFILGPVVAVLSIVPYLALVGVPVSIVLLASQGYDDFRGQWWWFLGAPTVFYFVGQALDDYLWTPKIQGKGTDMSTPMILFASLAGGVLFGVFGLLIAIPITACLKILIQEVFWPRFKDWAEGREEDFLPIGRD